MRKASRQEVQKAIHEGIVFRKSKNQGFEDDKVRTKAKKKSLPYRFSRFGICYNKSRYTQTPRREIQAQINTTLQITYNAAWFSSHAAFSFSHIYSAYRYCNAQARHLLTMLQFFKNIVY